MGKYLPACFSLTNRIDAGTEGCALCEVGTRNDLQTVDCVLLS